MVVSVRVVIVDAVILVRVLSSNFIRLAGYADVSAPINWQFALTIKYTI